MKVSEALAAILEVSNAAKDHAQHCDCNCTVSLHGLKRAAYVLLPLCWVEERERAQRCIDAMPLT